MKLGILFNCQHLVLGEVARLALPEADIQDYDLGQLLLHPASQQSALTELATCDHVLALEMDAGHGVLANDAMRSLMRKMTVLPGFSFGGFHPDTIYVQAPGGWLNGFTHHYHSRIALAGYLSGRTARETVALYNALVMGRAGYFDAYAQWVDMACAVHDPYGVDLRPMFARLSRRGCFMHSINHPMAWCYAEVCLELLRHAGLVGEMSLDFDAIPDGLRIHPTHPVLPPLARRLGVPAGTGFKPYHPTEDHSVPLERFVELEYEAFFDVPAADLAAAPGIAALRPVIG